MKDTPIQPRLLAALLLAAGLLATSSGAASGATRVETGSGGEGDFFEANIRPVLVEHCYDCHSAEADILHGGLRVDTREGLRRGGDSGPAVLPGDVGASLLIDALRHESFQMPPSGKLPDRVIADFARWVQTGAHDPRGEVVGTSSQHAVRREDGILNRIDYDDGRRFWSIIPPQRPSTPQVRMTRWVRTPVDAFVLARLEGEGLEPGPEAARETLLRRVTFDLIGLPPTPEEIDAFVADSAPGAYERVVDRLLASPHYGERWGRHWLDVVRYSDSNGLDENYYFGYAWRYRDYVVDALNDDKPYDDFIAEQLAGDLLADEPGYAGDAERRREALTATGFLAIGPKMQSEPDNGKRIADTVDELIDVTSRAFLGLSVACARCHNHKFDPVSQRDYYALAGVFRSCAGPRGKRRDAPVVSAEEKEAYEVAKQRHQQAIKRDRVAQKEVLALRKKVAERPADVDEASARLDRLMTDRKPLQEAIVETRKQVHAFPHVHTMHRGDPQDVPVHIRGSHINLAKEPEPRGVLALTANSVAAPEIPADAPGRLELARWLADPRHPLTARVMVNRVWQGHFGRGLVDTPNDFGFRGSAPTHPELLDFLAREFVDGGWSIKRLHRLMVLSSVYRQSSRHRAGPANADPDNRLLWRQNRRRLEAEPLRDNLLAVAGLLQAEIGGRVFDFPNGERVTNDQSANYALASYASHRRAIYLPVIRVATYSMFGVFDLNDPSRPIAARGASVVSPQALFMMNSELVNEAAAAFADRLLRGTPRGSAAVVRRAYRLAYGRSPTDAEVSLAVEFLGQNAHLPRGELWKDYCQALMAASEFIYVD